MQALKLFFQNRETYIGIATALLFLLIFFCVWLTAYDGVTDRAEELRIGIVNEDEEIGTTIEQTILNSIPFKVESYSSLDTAQQDMNGRQLDMVMLIPKGFSEEVQLEGESELQYFINQANTSLAKQIMESASSNITDVINEKVYVYKQQLIAQQGSDSLKTIIPSEELALNVSANLTQVIQSLNSQSVQSSVQKTNNAEGFAVTMVPLMIVLASFVGSMIMSMNLNLVAMRLTNTLGKWSVFLARQIINLGAAIILAIITLILLFLFNIELTTSLFQTWLFQATVFFAFLSLTQLFVILFGTAGMVFNITLLSMQLVTSGAIVPKVMLSNFYQTIGSYLPATYAVNGYFTVTFGGDNLSFDISLLLIISVVTISIALIKVIFQKSEVQQLNEKVTN
nr:ABC transporter permease [Lysinibacillus timonensis]